MKAAAATVTCMAPCNIEIRILIKETHFGSFRLPVILVILNDAQCINPNVANLEGTSNSNRILKSLWQLTPLNALFPLLQSVASRSSRRF